MHTGLNKVSIWKSSFQFALLPILSIFLASCGVIQASNVEEMGDSDRHHLLSTKTDKELCNAYNNSFIKRNTERQIEKILQERNITKCEALAKVRLIPLDIASNTTAESAKSIPIVSTSDQRRESTPVAQAQPVMPAIVFGNKEQLVSDIEVMLNEDLAKGSFESNQEYSARKNKYFEQFKQGKGYRVSLDIDNPQNKKDKLVYFEPDRQELIVSMPSINRDLIWLDAEGKSNLKWIHHSFIQVHSTDHKLRTYKASNRLGASIEVIEMAITRYGLAVLSQATKDYGKDLRQSFVTQISKGEARELLEKGKIVLEVAFDPRYPISKGNPFLLKHSDTNKPTFDRPIDLTDTRYAIPVRLLKIRLINNSGDEVFSASGQQINATSITD